MQLDTAINQIEKLFTQMDALYGGSVFDEIAVVGFDEKQVKVYDYKGPREAEFQADFAEDSQALRRELLAAKTENGGEFSFTREGHGARTDAYICLGPGLYLFCNNTLKSMKEITQDPNWLNAQGEFLNLSQYFAVDPLAL